MATSGQLPNHLKVAARTGVLIARGTQEYPYRAIAAEIDMTAKAQTLVDLGGVPVPTENPKVIDTMIEKAIEVEANDFYLNLHLTANAIQDDQTGQLLDKFNGVLPSFQRHINNRVFKVLNGGDGSDYGQCYDGSDFFDSDHTDEGGKYQTNQDNEYTLTLNDTNFDTVWVACQNFKDDVGEFTNFMYDLLVVPPALRKVAHQIANNPWVYDTANREENPYEGEIRYMTSPELDSTAWYLIASNENVKPLIVVVRKRPQLNGDPVFDPFQDGGGVWTFPYHGRYEVFYGDWRLACQGQT